MSRALEVLQALVEELSQYNDADMLDGYMNSLSDKYKEDLAELGLPTIKKPGYNRAYLEGLDYSELLDLIEDNYGGDADKLDREQIIKMLEEGI
jgi:hypothetical protein